MATPKLRPSACSIPAPDGWECVLGDGHDGVCARTPTTRLDDAMWTPEPDLVITADARSAELAHARAELDIANADRQALSGALADVLGIIDKKQHLFPDAQRLIAEAYALLVGTERTVSPATREWLGKRGMK